MDPKFKKWIAILFFALVAFFVYFVHEVLTPFIISGVLVYILAPAVNYLSGRKFLRFHTSRSFSVMLIYIYLFIIVIISSLIIFPPLYEEVIRLANDLPGQIKEFRTATLPVLVDNWEKIIAQSGLKIDLNEYINQSLEGILRTGEGELQSLAEYTQKFIGFLFSTLSTFLVIFIVTAFVLIDLPGIKKSIIGLIPLRYRESVISLGTAIDGDLSGTIRGQLLICLINGTLTVIGLLILQVKFAITIGLVAGVFSLIPVFGAVISTIPAVLIALTQSLWTALFVVLYIIGIHLLEANILNPKILGHTVHLHPSVIVFSIVVGEHFFGAIGLLFGVPVAAIIRSILQYSYRQIFLTQEDLAPNDEIKHLEAKNDPPETLEVQGEPA